MYCGELRHCFCPPLEGGKREGEGGLGKRKREEGREKKRPKIRAEGEGQFCAPVTPKEGRREEGNINAPRERRRRRRRRRLSRGGGHSRTQKQKNASSSHFFWRRRRRGPLSRECSNFDFLASPSVFFSS